MEIGLRVSMTDINPIKKLLSQSQFSKVSVKNSTDSTTIYLEGDKEDLEPAYYEIKEYFKILDAWVII